MCIWDLICVGIVELLCGDNWHLYIRGCTLGIYSMACRILTNSLSEKERLSNEDCVLDMAVVHVHGLLTGTTFNHTFHN